jgi:hypothetical protein
MPGSDKELRRFPIKARISRLAYFFAGTLRFTARAD